MSKTTWWVTAIFVVRPAVPSVSIQEAVRLRDHPPEALQVHRAVHPPEVLRVKVRLLVPVQVHPPEVLRVKVRLPEALRVHRVVHPPAPVRLLKGFGVIAI